MRHDEAATEATDSDETPAPLRRRKAHIRESNEAHLLACAEAVFAERGLDGASTAMIAERAGLPKANLHYYFPTKLALYRRVLDDLFEDWHRAAGSFEADDDPVEAIGAYVRAKMALSRRRPLGSKVWANEIIHGAEHMQDILSERVKPWFDTRVKVIDGWIARGLLAPIDAHALMYLIWATTQHYADFDAQVRALSGKRTFTQKAYDEQTEQVVQLVLRACGAVSPRAKA
ncbi:MULTISPECIES: TetR/AcrR family transcriptional regulator [unclassified Burkholderia]|uniref:TetR/AcrR family transcriptional regulator n=1 Tax=unclassified Burkholderia TaxID=2613784 RepID=UPI00141FDC36|nr:MULTISPECIES: TetR/AcrR family transcriptional regulator [unclassified Burkholderia]NIE57112.1 TetR family transcriptional regulator [Burkholderia sp. Ap-955]NIF13641.1 TetR family transcriptional regulator [Burkholderia sp. Ax-1735]NIG06753.1 TetR family transcriptional regulator [Burkholderia sp. Tr-849]